MITVAVSGSPEAASADFVCDGSDDQIEINAAIALAASQGGGDVSLAAGTYSTSANVIVLGDGVHIEGAGAGATVFQMAVNWHAVAAPSGAVLSGAVTFCGVNDFSCKGITVDAQTNNIVGCNGIENVPAGEGSDTTEATQGTVCTNGVISNNEVLLPQGHNYSIWNLRGENVQILNNVIDGGATLENRDQSQEGIEIFGGHHVTVSGNTVSNIGNNAIFVQSIASQVPHSDYSDITITDNTVDFATNGVLLTTSSDSVNGSMDGADVTVSGNTIRNTTDAGIGLRNDSGSTTDPVIFARISVTDNTIRMLPGDEGAAKRAAAIFLQNNTGEGETLFSDIHIDGNHIIATPTTTNFGQVTIVFYENFTFSENDVTISDADSASYLASILFSSNFVADGNTFTGAGAAGVSISGSDHFVWSENSFFDWDVTEAGYPALSVTASSAYSIADNNFSAVTAPGSVIALGQNFDQTLTGNTFVASYDYSLPPNLSNLILTGAAVSGTGNDLNNTIVGNALTNILAGGEGNDTYFVQTASDSVSETANQGYDILYTPGNYVLGAGSEIEQLTTTNNAGTNPINLTGNEFGQLIRGNSGDNVLDGKAGADTMIGLDGNDNYYVDHAGDIVTEGVGGGYDIVRTSIDYTLAADSEVEQLGTTKTAGTGPLNLTGNEFGQLIRGNDGDNIINGKGGVDTLVGLGGNDTYFVDNPGDVVTESHNGGYDIVYTSVSYALTPGSEIEQLGTSSNVGTAPINLTGNEFRQLIRGNAGDNIIDGKGGVDTLIGLGGNDNYSVSDAGTVVTEAAGGGYDIVRASVNYTLTAGSEVEQLGTTNTAGTDPINLTGNTFNQLIRGNAGDNVLTGGGGNDVFTTGAGHDTIVFNNSIGPNNAVTVTDFDPTLDQFALNHLDFPQLPVGQLDPSMFANAGSVTTSAQHVIYDAAAGSIYYDTDGSGVAEAILFAHVTPHLAITSNDFFIV